MGAAGPLSLMTWLRSRHPPRPEGRLAAVNCLAWDRSIPDYLDVHEERILRHIVFTVMILLARLSMGQAKVSELAVPPAGAEHFTIMSTAGVHGHSARWTAPDGSLMGRESLVLRGQVAELDSKTHLGADHMIDSLTIRGFTPQGDAAESFSIHQGRASWKSEVDAGSAAYARPAFYCAFNGPVDVTALLAEVLFAAQNHTITMLPGGTAHLDELTSVTVGNGALKKTLTAYAVSGIVNTPTPVWLDEKGKFFALDGGLTWIRAGYESSQPMLDKAQDEALAVRSRLQAGRLATTPAGPLAFTHVRSFVDGSRFVEDETVVVDKGIITQAGAFAEVTVPPGAQIIDGSGKALMPGLWDAHQHVGDDASATMLLSLGITSVRDPGNNNALTQAPGNAPGKGRVADAACVSILTDRRQRPEHSAAWQCCDLTGRGDRTGAEGEGRGIHGDQVLWNVQPSRGCGNGGRSSPAGPACAWTHSRGHADHGRYQ